MIYIMKPERFSFITSLTYQIWIKYINKISQLYTSKLCRKSWYYLHKDYTSKMLVLKIVFQYSRILNYTI